MAYDARQQRIMAYAIALTGGNVAAAARWLKAHSVECEDVGESTLRRMLERPGFAEEVAQQGQIIREESEAALRVTERERFKREIEGSFFERISAMEAKGWELFERISKEMNSPDRDLRDIMSFWKQTQEFAVRLRTQAAPAVSDLWESECLIRAYAETMQKEFGPGMAQKVNRAVLELYQKFRAARQAQVAEVQEDHEQR